MTDQTPQDETLPPNPVGKDQPAEGGEVPEAGPGAEHASEADVAGGDKGA
jgi:hypothetical protein